MPFLTLSSGLTIKVPTRGTVNWDEVMKDDTFQKISEHDHTGSGKGLQIASGAIADDAITSPKILIANDTYIRMKNLAGTATNIFKFNALDKLEISQEVDLNGALDVSSTLTVGGDIDLNAAMDISGIFTANDDIVMPNLTLDGTDAILKSTSSFVMTNNQSSAANVTGISLTATAGNGGTVKYTVYRDGTADLMEKGEISFSYDGAAWDLTNVYEHDDAGILFSITSGGQLQYTSTDQTGHVTSTMYFTLLTVGV